MRINTITPETVERIRIQGEGNLGNGRVWFNADKGTWRSCMIIYSDDFYTVEDALESIGLTISEDNANAQ